MNDAISRSALMRRLEEAEQRVIHGGEWPYTASVLAKVIVKVKEFVAELPALDVAPAVHARWIEDGYRGIPCVCSHCGEEAHYMSIFKEQFDYDWDENLVPCGYEEIREYIKSKSCPECGARMDGEAE